MSGPTSISQIQPSALLLEAQATAAPDDAEHAKLRASAHAMEGLFLRQLFSAMRANATVDGASAVDGSGAGGELFTSMLDDEMADKASERTQGGLGEMLYKQLSNQLGAMTSSTSSASSSPPSSSPAGA